MEDCLFCKIIAGDIPSSKVYEDDLCYAFNDIDPQAPTHFLVIPKQHIKSVAAVDASNSAVVAHCFEVIGRRAKPSSKGDAVPLRYPQSSVETLWDIPLSSAQRTRPCNGARAVEKKSGKAGLFQGI